MQMFRETISRLKSLNAPAELPFGCSVYVAPSKMRLNIVAFVYVLLGQRSEGRYLGHDVQGGGGGVVKLSCIYMYTEYGTLTTPCNCILMGLHIH